MQRRTCLYILFPCILLWGAPGWADTGTMVVGDVSISSDSSIRSEESPILFCVTLEGDEMTDHFYDKSETIVSGTPRLPFTFEYRDSGRKALRYADYIGTEDRDLYFAYKTTADDDQAEECRFDFPLALVDASIVRTNAEFGQSWLFKNQVLYRSASVDVNYKAEEKVGKIHTMQPLWCSIQSSSPARNTGSTIMFSMIMLPPPAHLVGYETITNNWNYFRDFQWVQHPRLTNAYWCIPWSTWFDYSSRTIVTGNPKLPFQLVFQGDQTAIRYANFVSTDEEKNLYFSYTTTTNDDGVFGIQPNILPLVLDNASIVRTNVLTGESWLLNNSIVGESTDFSIDFHDIVNDAGTRDATALHIAVGQSLSIPVRRAEWNNQNPIHLKAALSDSRIAGITESATIVGNDGSPAVFEVTGLAPGHTTFTVSTLALPVHALEYDVTVHEAPVVSGVSLQQRYPWNGLVDIEFDLSGDASCEIALSAAVEGTGEELPVQSVTVYGTDSTDLLVDSGKVHLVWDAGRDVPGRKFDAVRLTVTATPVAFKSPEP